MAYISPTGYNDPSSQWTWESRAYDGSTVYPNTAYGEEWLSGGEWGSYIELTHAEMRCTKVKFYAQNWSGDLSLIDIDVYYSGGWHDVYQGAFSFAWVEKTFAVQNITKFRFRTRRFYACDYKGSKT